MRSWLLSVYRYFLRFTNNPNSPQPIPHSLTVTPKRDSSTLDQKVFALFHNHERYVCLATNSNEIRQLRDEHGYYEVETAILKIANRVTVYGGSIYDLKLPCACTEFNKPRPEPLRRRLDGSFSGYESMNTEPQNATFTCKYCGSPTEVDPSDQTPPADYCQQADHQSPST